MSKLLQRHYLKEFFKLFAVIVIGLSLILSLFDLIKRIDDFMPHKPSPESLLLYAALVFPRYFLYIMPAAVLICSLYTVSHAVRTKEIVAIMAAGGRVKKLLMPFVLTGVILSLAGFALGEFVVPASAKKAEKLKRSIMKKTPMPSLFKDGMLWLRAKDGSIVKIDFYLEDRNAFKGMSIFKIEHDRLKEIIKAETALYAPDANAWILKNVKIYDTETGDMKTLEEMHYPYLGSPQVFREEVQKPYEMGIVELYRYLKRLKEAGFKNLRLTVEMNSKIAYPLVNLFMIVIGVSFPARRTFGGLVATAIGLLISLLYWFGYTMTLSLGYAGILPPLASVWIMPLVFSALAVHLYRKIPE